MSVFLKISLVKGTHLARLDCVWLRSFDEMYVDRHMCHDTRENKVLESACLHDSFNDVVGEYILQGNVQYY